MVNSPVLIGGSGESRERWLAGGDRSPKAGAEVRSVGLFIAIGRIQVREPEIFDVNPGKGEQNLKYAQQDNGLDLPARFLLGD